MPACAQYFSGCCNGKCYDVRTQMCCQGQVVTKCADDQHASCCAYECFNNQTSTCCNSYYVIQSKCPGDRCCGSVCCDEAGR
uniref:Uncharacterized protein n=1 Tax=Romanomermis culicivorax TaxID=13658 RepID=A0A915IHU5_ROMCU